MIIRKLEIAKISKPYGPSIEGQRSAVPESRHCFSVSDIICLRQVMPMPELLKQLKLGGV